MLQLWIECTRSIDAKNVKYNNAYYISLVKKQTHLYIVVKEYSGDSLLSYFCVILSTLYQIIERVFSISRHIFVFFYREGLSDKNMRNNGKKNKHADHALFTNAHIF